MTTVVITQPTYLPWTGYFRVIKEADIGVFLDNVQFETRSWQSRNRIKTPHGWIWLTVPTHHNSESKICDVEIDNSKPWKRQHLNAIKTCYGKAKYFKDYFPFFKSVYESEWTKIAALDMHIIKYLANQLGLNTLFLQASNLEIEGKRTRLLFNICKKLNANRYVSSIGAKKYMEDDGAKALFEKGGIEVEFLQFNNPTYPQLFGDFIPEMSFLDCLFNCGPECSKIMSDEKVTTFEHLSK
ncbi:MAG: WbqC family protein [Promethearchaeota archaeon]